jgi:hypothetical protein
MSGPLTVRQMSARLKLYRLCRLVAAQLTKKEQPLQD